MNENTSERERERSMYAHWKTYVRWKYVLFVILYFCSFPQFITSIIISNDSLAAFKKEKNNRKNKNFYEYKNRINLFVHSSLYSTDASFSYYFLWKRRLLTIFSRKIVHNKIRLYVFTILMRCIYILNDSSFFYDFYWTGRQNAKAKHTRKMTWKRKEKCNTHTHQNSCCINTK